MADIDVINLQRMVKLETDVFRKYVQMIAANIPEVDSRRFSVAFVSDGRMRQLNEMFRGVDSTTDVLSFPYERDIFAKADTSTPVEHSAHETDDFIGDIVISAEQAKRQAGENGLPLEREIMQLILHGLLHLCGYDHETDSGEMNSRELDLRDRLKI